MKFWRQRKDAELDAEIRSHLNEAIRDRIERGETPGQARANALREFGNVGLVKEVTREMWGWASLERLGQDLRFGLRMLRKHPGFSLVAILTLALGIGANAAIFSVVNAVLLRSLPYLQAERLVVLWEKSQDNEQSIIDAGNFFDWKEHNSVLADMAAFGDSRFILTGDGEPQEVVVQRMSANLFSVLGVNALLGRTFAPDESEAGRNAVVVISYECWQRRFGGDPQVIGRKVNFSILVALHHHRRMAAATRTFFVCGGAAQIGSVGRTGASRNECHRSAART